MTINTTPKVKQWPAVKGESGVDVAIRQWRAQAMREQVDAYGLALMMIREGAGSPKEIAAKVLAEWTDRVAPTHPLTPERAR